MKKSETTMRAVLIDGQAYERKPDGPLVPLVDRTDYARLDNMSAAEVERLAAADTEGAPMMDDEWAKGEVHRPLKVPVGLKIDDDVLSWFKARGRGYQTRMNAVLRRYMETHRKAG